MAALFLYQQSRGGIIDVEAEENKLLLVTESPSEGASSDPPSVVESAPRSASPVPSPSGGGGGGARSGGVASRGKGGPRSFGRLPRPRRPHPAPRHAHS